MKQIPIKITRISDEVLKAKVADNLVVDEDVCPITSTPVRTKICEKVTSGGAEFLVVCFQTMLKLDHYHNHAFVIDTANQTCFEIVLTTENKEESANVAQAIADAIIAAKL